MQVAAGGLGEGGAGEGASVWIRPPFGGNGLQWGCCLSLSPPPRHPPPVLGYVQIKGQPCVFFLTALSVGYFLKPVGAFFFHEKKVAPLPLGSFFLQFKKR